MNTSFIERLNLTIRRSSAYLSRRTLSHARSTERLDELCIVKTAPPTKSRTYAPLEFRAEDGETPPLCSTFVVFLVLLGVRAIRAMCRHRADLVLCQNSAFLK